jgi:carbamoyltransferase
VPVLLNTSFNVKGEPIVETPADAINCFLATGIDYLILHDVVMSKKPAYRVVRPVASFFSDVGNLVRATLSTSMEMR